MNKKYVISINGYPLTLSETIVLSVAIISWGLMFIGLVLLPEIPVLYLFSLLLVVDTMAISIIFYQGVSVGLYEAAKFNIWVVISFLSFTIFFWALYFLSNLWHFDFDKKIGLPVLVIFSIMSIWASIFQMVIIIMHRSFKSKMSSLKNENRLVSEYQLLNGTDVVQFYTKGVYKGPKTTYEEMFSSSSFGLKEAYRAVRSINLNKFKDGRFSMKIQILLVQKNIDVEIPLTQAKSFLNDLSIVFPECPQFEPVIKKVDELLVGG